MESGTFSSNHARNRTSKTVAPTSSFGITRVDYFSHSKVCGSTRAKMRFGMSIGMESICNPTERCQTAHPTLPVRLSFSSCLIEPVRRHVFVVGCAGSLACRTVRRLGRGAAGFLQPFCGALHHMHDPGAHVRCGKSKGATAADFTRAGLVRCRCGLLCHQALQGEPENARRFLRIDRRPPVVNTTPPTNPCSAQTKSDLDSPSGAQGDPKDVELGGGPREVRASPREM